MRRKTMRNRGRRGSRSSEVADVSGYHLRHWGVFSALLIAILVVHIDVSSVEGAGRQRQTQLRLRKGADDAGGAGAAGGGIGEPPPKPLLVPDPNETNRDPLISGRVKHVRLTKNKFKSEEHAMVETRLFLKKQNQIQAAKELNLRYLNMHAGLLTDEPFQRNLVKELKKVKDQTGHILNVGGRHGRAKRRTPEKEEEREANGEWAKTESEDDMDTKIRASQREGNEEEVEERRRIEDSGEEETKVKNGEVRRRTKREAGRRGVPPWKDYLYNLPSNMRGKYHQRKEKENQATEDNKTEMRPAETKEEELRSMTPDEEAAFRRNLDELLAQLDDKVELYKDQEEQKILGLERQKSAFLEHAERLGEQNRKENEPYDSPPSVKEVSDLINAAELENMISKEKNKYSNIVGNSNERPSNPFRRDPQLSHRGDFRVTVPSNEATNEVNSAVDQTTLLGNNAFRSLSNELTPIDHEDNEISNRIHDSPILRADRMIDTNSICPAVDGFVDGCQGADVSREHSLIFEDLCARHEMCYRCGIAADKERATCDKRFADGAVVACRFARDGSCLNAAQRLLSHLQRNVFYFYPFPLGDGGRCSEKCVRDFIES